MHTQNTFTYTERDEQTKERKKVEMAREGDTAERRQGVG
jgi:hypothetical protein